MKNEVEMRGVLIDFDDDDYDVVKELIPWVLSESLEEYNQSFNYGDDDRDDLKFIIGDRIYWFLIDNSGWSEVDLDMIIEIVYEHYEK